MGKIITREGIEKLKQESLALNVKLTEVKEIIKQALKDNDIVENCDYNAAKEEQERILARQLTIDALINDSIVIEDDKEEGRASLGNVVEVKFKDTDEVEKFKLCSSVEADPIENLISIESPIGVSLYKRRVGDTVSIESPDGKYEVEILSII